MVMPVSHSTEVAKPSSTDAEKFAQLDNYQQWTCVIADAMQYVPPLTHEGYKKRCEWAAMLLGVPESEVVTPTFGPFKEAEVRNAAMYARNRVFEVISQVNSFVARAKNAGFSPPDNPFSLIHNMNLRRKGLETLVVDTGLAKGLMENVSAYVNLLEAEQAGRIDLNRHLGSSTQLSSVSLSLDGFGGSGNVSADLMRFLPDADAIKEQKAKEALAVLDFKKRIPKVVFTARYSPDGSNKGPAIVGWKKIPDASGYIIKRRGIFDGKEKEFNLSNQAAKSTSQQLSEYVNTWVLSFYDDVDPNSMFFFADKDLVPDGYYTYVVQAYQVKNKAKGTIFQVETIPANLSALQRSQMRKQIEAVDPGTGPDTISPYPLLSKYLLGNDQYDWILAGVNVRASISRNDSRTATRKYSYLVAQLDHLFSQMDQGKFVVPKDVSQVRKAVSEAVVHYGVSQVIEELVSETGVLYFFEGKDAKEDTHFDMVGTEKFESSNLLATVVSAINPETATLNLKTLATNLPQLLSGGPFVTGKLGAGSNSNNAKSEEIVIDYEPSNVSEGSSEDEVKFFQQILTSDSSVDLTTFDGLSSMMRAIRILSDIGPNRGTYIEFQENKIVIPATVVDTGPAPSTFSQPSSTPAKTSSTVQTSAPVGKVGNGKKEVK